MTKKVGQEDLELSVPGTRDTCRFSLYTTFPVQKHNEMSLEAKNFSTKLKDCNALAIIIGLNLPITL